MAMALEFSPETYKKFEATVARYPKKEAAMLPVLYLAQQEFGHLGAEAIECVARLMDQAPARVQGVVSFYTPVQHEADRAASYSSLPDVAVRAARR